jgi:hypothetical protein
MHDDSTTPMSVRRYIVSRMGQETGGVSGAGGALWDARLVTYVLDRADEDLRPPEERSGALIEGYDNALLLCGCLLQHCRDVMGWPPSTFPQMLNTMCRGRSLHDSIHFLADCWVFVVLCQIAEGHSDA